ncbi:MAG: DUF4190 domain-containing protein [Acidobacteriia bacterium]|nr:DUF4190 domain-containing protein [Terriglobia bacterium]
MCPACGGPADSRSGSPAARSIETPTPGGLPATGPSQLPRNDGFAIGSLILGLLALYPFLVVTGIPAVIMGHFSRARIHRSQGRLRGKGMALAGLLMGYISILLVSGIGARNMMKTRSAANESGSESNMRKVSTLIATYRLTYDVYPPSLAVMGPAAGGSPNATDANLLRAEELSDMASGKRGYIYTYQRTSDGYILRADPVSFRSGTRHYYMDQTGSLRFEEKQPAGPGSNILGWLPEGTTGATKTFETQRKGGRGGFSNCEAAYRVSSAG